MVKGIAEINGFKCGVGRAGLKKGGDYDVLVIASDRDCDFAAVLTGNDIKAAPVKLTESVLRRKTKVRGIVANSGNANACTGKEGLRVASYMKSLVEGLVGGEFLVASTGVIGEIPDAAALEKGIIEAVENLGMCGGELPAVAIMTTDSFPKVSFADCGEFSIGGIAKGAGMIDPTMSTMLSFIVTDAKVESSFLKGLLGEAVRETFNAITVDGDMSTNDCVFLLSNGASGYKVDESNIELFLDGLKKVTGELATKIVSDGEGATKLIKVIVEDARDREQALKVARKVATSPLVKTAVHGGDPNWGRIVAAAGSSMTGIVEDSLKVYIGDYLMFADGEKICCDEDDVARYLKERQEVVLRLNLGIGDSRFEYLTCDLTCDYIRINAEYRT